MKILGLIFGLCLGYGSILYAQIMPQTSFKVSGGVTDIVIVDETMYVGTNASSVDIINLNTKAIEQKIKLPQIKDFMGDIIDSKVYSVDVLGKHILILSQDEKGYRKIDLYNGERIETILDAKDRMYIAKAKFLDKENIVFALLSNEIISYNIKDKKENWHEQVAFSKFSDFVMDEKKQTIIIADESGNLKLLDLKSGKLVKTLRDQNLDNVFQVDIKNNIIATAGQDRKVILYNQNTNTVSHLTSGFLIYSVGLSPSGNIVAYSCDEASNVAVHKTNTLSKIGIFSGSKMTLSKILFKNEKEFFVGSDSPEVLYYKLK